MHHASRGDKGCPTDSPYGYAARTVGGKSCASRVKPLGVIRTCSDALSDPSGRTDGTWGELGREQPSLQRLGEAPLGAEALRLEVVHQGWHEGKGDLVLEVAV